MKIHKIEGPELQASLINRLAESFAGDERVLACWLHGSFATETSDKYSDIDMAVAVEDEEFHYVFPSVREKTASAGEPLASWDSPKDVDGAGFTFFYSDCTFLDVKIYRASRVQFLNGKGPARVLFDRRGIVRTWEQEASQEEHMGPPLHEVVHWKMLFLWICAYSAVRFLKRGEYWYASGMLNAVRGTMAQLFWLWKNPDKTADMSFIVWGVIRRDLGQDLVAELASTVSEAEKAEMTGALGKLLELFHKYGRRIAQDTGADYPERMAEAVTKYYHDECLGI